MKVTDHWTIIGLLLTLHSCCGFHDVDNVMYDCWPLGANSFTHTISCGGLSVEWPQEPPDRVERGQKFNVTYLAIASDSFYTGLGVFPGFNESSVRHLCMNTTCPSDASNVNRNNCCVWHANIHTCHPSVVNRSSECGPGPNVCGPWVADDGQLATHTESQYGSIDQMFTAINVKVDFEGVNFIIAHLRVGNLQIALGKPIEVIAPRVCGDGFCTAEVGETCVTCSVDCCPTSGGIVPGVIAGIVIAGLFVVSLFIAIVIGIVYYVHRRKLFFDESWIINYDDIKRDTGQQHTHGSKSMLTKMIANEVKHRPSSSGTLYNGDMPVPMRQMFTDTGLFEGRTVAIKKVPRPSFVLNNPIRKEVLQIRVLDHPNVCKFIGATLKDPLNLAIITEYCPKGSLNDVLQNEDIPLNWGFRFSFVSDIARGMSYLHHNKIYHTRLMSSNCVIDDRWTAKITDFGLPSFRQHENLNKRPSRVSIGNYRRTSSKIGSECTHPLTDAEHTRSTAAKIYLPPEVRHNSFHPPQPTTDIYSFAILLVEVATRIDPYSGEVSFDSTLKPKIKLDDLTTGETPCPCPHEYFELISKCWSIQSQNRPSFEHIKKTLLRINPSRESPVDTMMLMMEKYSKHLEVLVAERTQELIAEQNKTAHLLHSMLPKAVADDLKHGKSAPATSFKSATIFFSDIVGFTSLASTSTPMEIVSFLNELYTTFDDTLDHFDVYKVETIGDAYMVVSGVPNENGDRHAGEIASMALALLASSRKFKIPHRPDVKLEIRAGIHSGPVCAGVIGLKMPRYCLFGDTVNTASRMESTSEAMKIQCSDKTHQLLVKLGGYELESRGSITVKGKGSMETWWIRGKSDTTHSTRDSQQAITSPSSKIITVKPILNDTVDTISSLDDIELKSPALPVALTCTDY